MDHLFAEPIQVYDNIISQDYNDELILKCYGLRTQLANGSDPWLCDIYTSFQSTNLWEFPEFELLLQVMNQKVQEFGEQLNGMEIETKCVDAFFNISGKGQYQEQHIHPMSHISAIYYLKAPEGSAPTVFKKPYTNMMYYPNPLFPKESESYDPVERRLVLFPSYLPHLVDQQKINQDRITIAANYQQFAV